MTADNIDLKLRGGINISFLLLVFLLPLLMWTRASEVFELPKMLFVYAMAAVIVGLWLGRMALRREILIRRTPLDIPILLFLISQLASTIYSIDPQVSWWGWYGRFHGGLWSTISYTLLYYAFVSNTQIRNPNIEIRNKSQIPNHKNSKPSVWRIGISNFEFISNFGFRVSSFIVAILASAAIVSGYAILQHFGIDKNFWVQDVANRVFSTQGQPNWLAGYIVALIFISMSKLLNFQFSIFNFQSILNLSIFNLLFIALLFTKSRSGLLGFAAADLTFWLVSLAKIRKKEAGRRERVKQFVFIHLVAIFLALITNNPVREWVSLRRPATSDRQHQQIFTPALEGGITLRKSEHGGTESGDIRRIVWTGALQLVKQRPVFGFGPETFGESYWRVRPKEHNLTSEWNFLYNKAHNEWLNLAANTGIFGLGSHILLLVWFSIWILKGPALPRQGRALSGYAILAALAGVEVVNFFGFSTVTVGVYRYLFMGIAVVILNYERRDRVFYNLISNNKSDGKVFLSKEILKKKMRDRVFYTLISNVNLWQYLGLATMAAGAAVTVGGIFFRFIADLDYNRGRMYADAGYVEEAMEPLMRAVNLVPEEPVFRAELAATEAALAALTSETYKGPAPPRRGRAFSEITLDLKNDSLSNFEIVRKQSPYNLGFLRSQAKAMFILGDSRQALQLMKLAMEMAPTDPKLPYSLGMMLSKMGQDEEAAVYYNKAVELKPDYPIEK